MDDDVPMDEDDFSPVGSGVALGSGEMFSSTSTTDGGASSLANSMDDSSEEPDAPTDSFAALTFEPDEALAQERIDRLYRQLDLSKYPLPRRWSSHDRFQLLTLSADFLRVRYNGEGKTHKDAAAIRADHPIPRILGIYYFEIHVVHQGVSGYVGIGLCEKTVSLNRLPGWDKCSYGYHGDDGNFFSSSGNGIKYGPQFTTNDIIGCGINFVTKEIFFTKNGEYLGKAVDSVNTDNDLYPTIGLQTRDVVIDTNFGQKPFRYNIAADIEQLQRATLRQVMNTKMSWKKNEWMNKACTSWFLHRGYTRAYEAMSKIQGIDLDPAEKELMQKQREYRKMMVNGHVSKVVAALENDMPEVLAKNKQLNLMLSTQQFIEMLKKRSRSRSRSKQRGSSVSISNGSSLAPASSSSTGKRPAPDCVPHPSRITVKRRTNGVERAWQDPEQPCSSANGNSAEPAPRMEEEVKNGRASNGKAVVQEDEDSNEPKPMEREVSVDAMTTTVIAEGDDDSENGVADGPIDGVINGYSEAEMSSFEKFTEIVEFGRTVHELSQTFPVPKTQLEMMQNAFSLVGRSWSEMKNEKIFDRQQRQEMSELLNIAILGHYGKRTTSLLTEHLLKAKVLERSAQRHNIGGIAFTSVEDFMLHGFDRAILRDDDEKKLILDRGEPIKFADDV